MGNVFLKLLNMSLTAGWMVLAVLLLRLLLKKAPKRIICVLWGLAALRLICPISPESAFSLIPDSEPIESTVFVSEARTDTLPVAEVPADYDFAERNSDDSVAQTAAFEQVMNILAVVWLTGMAVMLLYMVVSYVSLKRRVAAATILRDNIRQCETIPSPFVLGFIRPRIYLPYSVAEADIAHVIAHERAHIRRLDHLWKPIGFVILSVHWFNPVIWAAYICLCRDIEAACDEKVAAVMDIEERRAYSLALLNCAVHRRGIAACPLAFGEVGVKERVTNVMHYKKPAVWMIVLAVLACAVAAVCFLTDPVDDRSSDDAVKETFVLTGDFAEDYRKVSSDEEMKELIAYYTGIPVENVDLDEMRAHAEEAREEMDSSEFIEDYRKVTNDEEFKAFLEKHYGIPADEIDLDEMRRGGSGETAETSQSAQDTRVQSVNRTLNSSGGGQIVIDASVEEIPSDEVHMYAYKPLAVSDETREGLFDMYFGDRAGEVFRKSETQDIWQLGETMGGNFYTFNTVYAMDGSGDIVLILSYRRPNLNPLDDNLLGGAADGVCTITAEDAAAQCDRLLQVFGTLGTDVKYEVDSVLTYGGYTAPEMYFEEAQPVPFYWITYKRQLDGMPVTAYNDLYFFVTDDGVPRIHGALYDVQPMETDAELLSVTEAVEQMQKNTDSIDLGDQNTVRIGNICLEYLVRKQEGGTVIVPVWRFEIGETEEERILNRNLVLAVNAFTGEVIQDYSSYGGY